MKPVLCVLIAAALIMTTGCGFFHKNAYVKENDRIVTEQRLQYSSDSLHSETIPAGSTRDFAYPGPSPYGSVYYDHRDYLYPYYGNYDPYWYYAGYPWYWYGDPEDFCNDKTIGEYVEQLRDRRRQFRQDIAEAVRDRTADRRDRRRDRLDRIREWFSGLLPGRRSEGIAGDGSVIQSLRQHRRGNMRKATGNIRERAQKIFSKRRFRPSVTLPERRPLSRFSGPRQGLFNGSGAPRPFRGPLMQRFR
jgi:hypothetical protein